MSLLLVTLIVAVLPIWYRLPQSHGNYESKLEH
jgi:hypothetical protein